MLKDYDISFESGTIISGSMLRNMCYGPKELFRAVYTDRSDGIISGMDIRIEKNALIVTAGTFKSGNRLYVLEEDKKIDNMENGGFDDGGLYSLCISSEQNHVRAKDRRFESVTEHFAEICLIDSKDVTDDMIVLLSFKGVPRIPKNLSDLIKYKNTFNITYVCHSMYKEPTFQCLFFRAVYAYLETKKNKHTLDYMLMTEISYNGVVPMKMIKEYIRESKGTDAELNIDEEFVKQLRKLHPKERIVYSDVSDETDISSKISEETILLDD